MSKSIFLSLLLITQAAFAASVGELPFVQALINGRSVAPLPQGTQYQAASDALKARTGNNAPITVLTVRLFQFSEQKECGRIAFSLFQEATNTVWPETGGQMNICSNGRPPKRMCRGAENYLIAADEKCSDGSIPVDTPEVSKAIEEALKSGGQSYAQIRQRLLLPVQTKKN